MQSRETELQQKVSFIVKDKTDEIHPQSFIKALAEKEGLSVQLIPYETNPYKYSRSNLLINGYKCRILTRRSLVFHANGYICGSINSAYLTEMDFIILFWNSEIYEQAVYVIPQVALLNRKDVKSSSGDLRKFFYIPLDNQSMSIQTYKTDWLSYRNNFQQLKMPRI
jgi:hypothetical protein